MSEKCDQNVFNSGHSICMLDACMFRAEEWVQGVARESGQPVDWHYSGGIVNVLYIGDFAKVDAVVSAHAADLSRHMHREPEECGSCEGTVHRKGSILRRFGDCAHGPYRAGDPLPDDVIAVVCGSLEGM